MLDHNTETGPISTVGHGAFGPGWSHLSHRSSCCLSTEDSWTINVLRLGWGKLRKKAARFHCTMVDLWPIAFHSLEELNRLYSIWVYNVFLSGGRVVSENSADVQDQFSHITLDCIIFVCPATEAAFSESNFSEFHWRCEYKKVIL